MASDACSEVKKSHMGPCFEFFAPPCSPVIDTLFCYSSIPVPTQLDLLFHYNYTSITIDRPPKFLSILPKCDPRERVTF